MLHKVDCLGLTGQVLVLLTPQAPLQNYTLGLVPGLIGYSKEYDRYRETSRLGKLGRRDADPGCHRGRATERARVGGHN